MSITAITSSYGASTTSAMRSTSAASSQRTTASSASSESTTVSISDQARQAAASAGGIAVSDSIRQDAQAEQNRVFPQDILDAAQARLDANQGISGSSATPGLGNLPLLPENEALIAQIKSEMHAAHAANKDGMTNLTPYIRLINAIQQEGWKAPMTKEDAQREVDTSLAMAKLAPAASEAPLSEAQQQQKDLAEIAQFEKELAGEIPDKWKQRWQEEKLSMPVSATTTFPKSIWLGLSKAAGISEDEFLGKARELANNYTGNRFLQEIEKFVSQRYTASSGTPTTS